MGAINTTTWEPIMASVHSETLQVTINGNIITHHNMTVRHISELGYYRDSFSVQFTGGKLTNKLFDISYPMNEQDRKLYAGLIHRMNSENKLGKKVDTNRGKPENDPTPPGRGGGGVHQH